MASKKKLLQAAAGNAGGAALNVEDVFSVDLWTGNSPSTQTITNGIDFAGEGGLVWAKDRAATTNWGLVDTERGRTKYLASNATLAERTTAGPTYDLTSFNSNGYSLGQNWEFYANNNGNDTVGFSFRKAPKFFDVVTYTGNGPSNTQNISHNLGSAPGMLVVKATSTTDNWHTWHRGFGDNGYIMLNSTNAKSTYTGLWDDTAPTATHFTVSEDCNTNNVTYVAYLFAHDPMDGFVEDVQEYYANGSNISGFNGTGEYRVYSNSNNGNIFYNAGPDQGQATGLTNFSGIAGVIEADTGQKVRVGPQKAVSGAVTFYSIITQNEPSETSENGLIVCGKFLGNASATGPSVDLGFEPQWLLIRNADRADDWVLIDSMRGIPSSSDGPAVLRPESSAAEYASGSAFSQASRVDLTATGFDVKSSNSRVNGSNQNMIYIAIRRPTAVPTDATEVFAITTQSGSTPPAHDTGFVTDFSLRRENALSSASVIQASDRLRGKPYLVTDGTNSEINLNNNTWDFMDGWFGATSNDSNKYAWSWKRAPKYFDVVAYTGTGATPTVINHNLNVAPEMMLIKSRTSNENWMVYHSALGNTKAMVLTTSTPFTANTWNNTTPSATTFTLGGGGNNGSQSGQNYIAYLFATLDGISKVGSYTGTGSDIDVDCGFTSGARFVLIKRADASSTGWGLIDTARGLTSSTDAYLFLNLTDAQGTSDILNPLSSGFKVVSTGSDWNASGGNYIFYAIA